MVHSVSECLIRINRVRIATAMRAEYRSPVLHIVVFGSVLFITLANVEINCTCILITSCSAIVQRDESDSEIV